MDSHIYKYIYIYTHICTYVYIHISYKYSKYTIYVVLSMIKALVLGKYLLELHFGVYAQCPGHIEGEDGEQNKAES